MTTWTEPKTFSAEPSSDTLWNTYLRDNMTHIKAPPTTAVSQTSAFSSLSTSSTAWGDITDMTATITTYGGDVLCIFKGFAAIVTNGGYLDLTLNSDRQGGTDGILGIDRNTDFCLCWLFQNLVAGTHTFKAQFKAISGGQLIINASCPPQFFVREFS